MNSTVKELKISALEAVNLALHKMFESLDFIETHEDLDEALETVYSYCLCLKTDIWKIKIQNLRKIRSDESKKS